MNLDVTELQSTLCPVCTEGSVMHHYRSYGGRACFSCRSFFRRAVQSENYLRFSCLKGQSCTIELRKKGQCKWCRFQRCIIKAGMRTEHVLNHGQRRQRLEIRKTKRAGNALRNALNLIEDNRLLGCDFSEDEVHHFRSLHQELHRISFEKTYEMYLANPSHLNVSHQRLNLFKRQ